MNRASLGVTIFSRGDYKWPHWDEIGQGGSWFRAWFLRPDEYSSGGTGIAVRTRRLGLGVQLSFHWH